MWSRVHDGVVVRNNPLMYVDPSGHEGVLVGMIIGAIIGGAVAAATDGDILMGMLTGAISGAFFGGASGFINSAVDAGITISSTTQAGIYAAAGGMSGGINAGITGGDVGTGVLSGAVFGGLTGYFGTPNFTPFGESAAGSIANRVFNSSLTGAAFGAAYAGMTGGDIWQGAASGALAWAAGEGINMLIGHGLGYAMAGKGPEFKNGAFYYNAKGATPFTIGGTIIGDKKILAGYNIQDGKWDYNHTVDQHERAHFPQQTVLSPSYIIAHYLSQGVGGLIGSVTGVGFWNGTHTYNIFERNWINVPCY